MILGWPWPILQEGPTLLPNAFVWKMLDFIETIEVYELKVGTSSWLSEYMNTYVYQRSRTLFDLCPRSPRFLLSNIYCKSGRLIAAKFHVELLWVVRMNVCSNCPGHMTKMATMSIYGRSPLKIFCESSRPMIFELGISHQGDQALLNLF